DTFRAARHGPYNMMVYPLPIAAGVAHNIFNQDESQAGRLSRLFEVLHFRADEEVHTLVFGPQTELRLRRQLELLAQETQQRVIMLLGVLAEASNGRTFLAVE